jgi:hypothetical protein
MNPLIRIRLGHSKELPLHFLNGILFQIRQNKQEFVGDRGSGTCVIRAVAADRARLPINSMGLHVGHKGLLKSRQQRLKFSFSEAGHCP